MTAPDVMVIGGGPAGSSAAIRLAATGRQVRLYEKAHFPRPKLCGGFLSPESLMELEELNILALLRRSGAVSLYRSVIASQGGAVIESSLPAEALSVPRDVLDDLLLREARRNGVDVREGEEGFAHAGESPCTVIAAGRTAGSSEQPARYFGIQALFQGVEGITDQVELDLIESGYVGLARQGNGVNVCALTTREALRRRGPDLDQVVARFAQENPMLRRHIKSAFRTGPWRTVGPVRPGVRRLAHDQTLYSGDAACVVDPFVGEGISIALYSSRLLQRALEQTLRPAAEMYAALWREAFLPALRWHTAMRLFNSIPVARELAFRALEWYPRGIAWATNLTRYRRLAGEEA